MGGDLFFCKAYRNFLGPRRLAARVLEAIGHDNIEHVQFTCQELSDSYSGAPFSYFDLIQHLAG